MNTSKTPLLWDIQTVQQELRSHRDKIETEIVDDHLVIVSDFGGIHDFEETAVNKVTIIGCCTSGSCTLRINLKDYDIRKDDLMVLLPDQWISMVKNNGFHCSCIILTPEISMQLIQIQGFLNFFLFLRKNPCNHLSPEEISIIREYQDFFEKRRILPKGAFNNDVIRHMLLGLTYELCDIASRLIEKQPKREKNRKDEYVESFLQELSSHYKQERSVRYYAERLHITPKYLSTIVHEVSGYHASDWINEVVINESKNLLKNTGKTIQEISDELNFCSQSFFGKYFKEHVGCSPKHYRKQTT